MACLSVLLGGVGARSPRLRSVRPADRPSQRRRGLRSALHGRPAAGPNKASRRLLRAPQALGVRKLLLQPRGIAAGGGKLGAELSQLILVRFALCAEDLGHLCACGEARVGGPRGFIAISSVRFGGVALDRNARGWCGWV